MELYDFLKEHFSFKSYFFQPSFPSHYLTDRIIFPLYTGISNISAGFIQLFIDSKKIRASIVLRDTLDSQEELTELLTSLLERYFREYSLYRIRLLNHSMILEID